MFPTSANVGVLSFQWDGKLLEPVTVLSFFRSLHWVYGTEHYAYGKCSINTGYVYRIDYFDSEKQKILQIQEYLSYFKSST